MFSFTKTQLDQFLATYKNRPINDNTGGMKIPHGFATFVIAKTLAPSLIIESGVWKGQGTWLFRTLFPQATILSFDLNFGYLEYVDKETHYIQHDLTKFDWTVFFQDNPQFNGSNSLLFLDDHVNFNERLPFIINETPFEHIIYEDNYPPTQGDVISPKKILESENAIINKNNRRTTISIDPCDKKLFLEHVDFYFTAPPIAIPETTRWGDEWAKNYFTPDPLFHDLSDLNNEIIQDLTDYTWLCYMHMKR